MNVTKSVLKKHIQDISNKYNNYLSSTMRYERFMVDETPKQWISLLGSDVCLQTHGEATLDIANQFIKYNTMNDFQITIDEINKLQIVSLIHDWGEIIVEGEGIGDITFENKNAENEAIEMVIFNKVISNIKEKMVKETLLKIYAEIIMSRESRLGDIFNAIERIGYLATAIRAYKGIKRERIKNWKGLVGNVLSNQIPKLLEYSKKYPYVNVFLSTHKKIIQKMLDETHGITTPQDKLNNPSFDKERLENAFITWHIYSKMLTA